MKILTFKFSIILLFAVLLNSKLVFSQSVKISDNSGVPNSNAILDVDISTNDKGILIPRLTSAQRTAMSLGSGDNGLAVYDETTNSFFYWNGTSWKEQTTQGANWSITGNSTINSTSNFIGTVDANDFVIRTNNTERARFLSDGKFGINTTSPDVYFHIFGDDTDEAIPDPDDATYSSGTGLFVLGDMQGRNLVLDQNEILARNNGSASSLYLQNRGGDIRIHYDRPSDTHDDGSQVIITDAGKLGVGFLTPQDQIHIYGTTPYLRFEDKDGGSEWNMGVNGGNTRFQIAEDDGTTYYPYRFVIKDGGNIGIGTVSPEGLLHIKAGEGNNVTLLLDADQGDDANDTWKLRSDATSHNLDFYNDVNSRVSFTSIGNVGIGTKTPEGRLHLSASEGNNATLIIDADEGDDANDTWKIRSIAANNNLDFINDVSTYMSIETGGNVGIGTNNPDAKLHVLTSGTVMGQYAGTVATFQQNSAVGDWSRMSLIGGNAGASVIDFGDADKQDIGMLKYDHTDNYLSYSYNSNEIMRIEDNGYVGIGKTNPSEKLDIDGAILIGNTGNSNTGAIKWTGTNFEAYDGSNWVSLTSSGGNWTLSGSNIYRNTGNVGINVTNPAEKLDVDGNIKLTGEVNNPTQGTANLIPIAYGIVAYDGSITNSGTGNWSVTRTSTGRYDITITSESYSSSSYMTQITPRSLNTGTTSNDVRVASFGDSSNKLRVYIKDGDGDFVNTTFHFIVFKP